MCTYAIVFFLFPSLLTNFTFKCLIGPRRFLRSIFKSILLRSRDHFLIFGSVDRDINFEANDRQKILRKISDLFGFARISVRSVNYRSSSVGSKVRWPLSVA